MLRPGPALVLEFSQVARRCCRSRDWYSFKLMPLMGKIIAKDADSYRYLAEPSACTPTRPRSPA